MQIIKIPPEGFGSNSYIVTADGKNAIIIDCARPKVYAECISHGFTPKAVLLTHGHFDHIGGCAKFFENGVPVYCGEAEKQVIFSGANLGEASGTPIQPFEIENTFKDGEEVTFCGIKIKIISTSGHTVGGVCYLIENNLFTGDTLFRGGIGRTDFPTGNAKQLFASVKKLFALEGDYKVYCGHGPETTLARERNNNNYII